MKRIINIALFVCIFSISIKAQQQVVVETSEIDKCKQPRSKDTSSLLHAFRNGQFSGHFRYFFMSTQNEKELTDYYANAIGGGLRFETARFHNFQFAISGFSVFNMGSSNLAKPESATGQTNRYEIGLFDINDLQNKTGITRLEEFYLKYTIRNSFLRIGRQFINATFINLQDGRMSPNAEEGVWAEVKEIKKVKIQLGWLWGISPRSTTKWYTPGQSIGVYSVGLNPDGSKSGYKNNIESDGIGLLQVEVSPVTQIKVSVSNMFVKNVFNTTLMQMDFTFPLKKGSSIFTSSQVIKQFAVNYGGNIDQSKTYFLKGSSSLTFGGRLGWKNNSWETSLNYNRITAEGRYLVPREWGIEPFFTFLPRERNDGFSNVHAILAKIKYNIPGARLKTSLAAGYYHLPDVKDCSRNKYGLPSYSQINSDIRYTFANSFRGLEAELLVATKLNSGHTYDNYRFIFNKVNMIQYNFVLNYTFNEL